MSPPTALERMCHRRADTLKLLQVQERQASQDLLKSLLLSQQLPQDICSRCPTASRGAVRRSEAGQGARSSASAAGPSSSQAPREAERGRQIPRSCRKMSTVMSASYPGERRLSLQTSDLATPPVESLLSLSPQSPPESPARCGTLTPPLSVLQQWPGTPSISQSDMINSQFTVVDLSRGCRGSYRSSRPHLAEGRCLISYLPAFITLTGTKKMHCT